MSEVKHSKEQKQIAVSAAILEVIEMKGLSGVTHSAVARKAKVSRAWIYEYVGKEKNALIEYAVEIFAREITWYDKTDAPHSRAHLAQQLDEAARFMLDLAAQKPVVIRLYFRFRGTANSVGQIIKKYESDWLKTATQSTATVLDIPQDAAKSLSEIMLILRLGYAHRVATATDPQTSRNSAMKSFDLIHSLLPSPKDSTDIR